MNRIEKILAERDNRIVEAEKVFVAAKQERERQFAQLRDEHNAKLTGLQVTLDAERAEAEAVLRDTARKFIEADMDDEKVWLEATSEAREEADRLIVEATAPPPTEPPVTASRPTAKQVAKDYAAAFLKAEAKRLGISATGTETVVAQRLLDSGWVPS